MRGFITEAHFASAERQFPGIRRFYEQLADKPVTFLELVWQYVHWSEAKGPAASSSSPVVGDNSPRLPA
jgi:hypothetical protein